MPKTPRRPLAVAMHPSPPPPPLPLSPHRPSSLNRSRPRSGARYSDRFIPSRPGSGDLQSTFALLPSENRNSLNLPPSTYSLLLKSELLDSPPPTRRHLASPPHPAPSTVARPLNKRQSAPDALHPGFQGLQRLGGSHAADLECSNMLRFQSKRSTPSSSGSSPSTSMSGGIGVDALGGSHRTALLNAANLRARVSRKIARSPFKVLDAPLLKDDFYLNLVDWSAENTLAVGLDSCVYLWSACTSVVTKLCDLQFGGPVCSVAWNQQANYLAVGTQPGVVQVWDVQAGKLLRTMSGHSARAGCLAWNSTLLSSGGRDKQIFNRDLRCKQSYIAQLCGHKQEVCGLKWSSDDSQLASGGNDNRLLIWNGTGLGSGSNVQTVGSRVPCSSPVLKFTCHVAAVKAIAWSPHARGLLASGGGTADRKIRFWNTITNSCLASVDTGSQVCNLAWSKNVNELVSTHGYSQNQIIVWKYPCLSKVVTLTGHHFRVLYLAMSPSGETIVTGAGDETLRFWNVFPGAKRGSGGGEGRSLLAAGRMSIR